MQSTIASNHVGSSNQGSSGTANSSILNDCETLDKTKPEYNECIIKQTNLSRFLQYGDIFGSGRLEGLDSLPGIQVTTTNPVGAILDFLVRLLSGIVGAVVLFRLVQAGLLSLSGTEESVSSRNAIIGNSIIGLVLVLLSGLIASGVLSFFWSGGSSVEDATPGITLIPGNSIPSDAEDKFLYTTASICPGDNGTPSCNESSLLYSQDQIADPTTGKKETYLGKAYISCGQLRELKEKNPNLYYDKDFRQYYLGLINQCGQQTFSDITFYIRNIIAFLYNILGSLMIIAFMIAGYSFIMSDDKKSEGGIKSIKRVFVGALVALAALPTMQFALRIIDSFIQN